MKKILILSLLFISVSSFAQKINLVLNLKKDSTYFLTTNANFTITETINGQEQVIGTLLSARIAHKVIAIRDTVYDMEVQYTAMSMHLDVAGKKMDFNSDDKNSENAFSKILSTILNKPFSMTISKTGKVLEMKNIENIYAHMFDNFPQVTEQQKAQFKTQMQQSFGEKSLKGNFQDAFAMFPGKQVSLNDKWVANSSLESIVSVQIKTTYTLQQITGDAIIIRGDAVIHAGNDAHYKPYNGISMRFINVDGTATTDLKLDRKTGWIINTKVAKVVKGTLEIEDSPKTPGGVKFPMSIVADLTVNSK